MGSFLNFVGVVAVVHGHDDGIGVKRVKLKSEVEDYVRFVSVCAVKRLAACEKKGKERLLDFVLLGFGRLANVT